MSYCMCEYLNDRGLPDFKVLAIHEVRYKALLSAVEASISKQLEYSGYPDHWSTVKINNDEFDDEDADIYVKKLAKLIMFSQIADKSAEDEVEHKQLMAEFQPTVLQVELSKIHINPSGRGRPEATNSAVEVVVNTEHKFVYCVYYVDNYVRA